MENKPHWPDVLSRVRQVHLKVSALFGVPLGTFI